MPNFGNLWQLMATIAVAVADSAVAVTVAVAVAVVYDLTLFVTDMHQNRPISPSLTPFDHFHFCVTLGLT